MAYKEPSDNQTEKNNTPSPLADNGQTLRADKTARLSSQDLTVLERIVRGQVSGLVGAMHGEVRGTGKDPKRLPDMDRRLHPELDDRARKLPAAQKAIYYRERFLKSLIDPDPRHHRELIDELLKAGIPLQTMAIHLLCPIATQLGNYWCSDDADFMQVAVASTRLSNVVNHLTHAGVQTSTRSSAKRILLARSRGTKHTLGVNLVRMCFRDMGWIVDGGADMEVGDTLFMRLSSRRYDLLGLSIGQLDEVKDCEATIQRCRSQIPKNSIRIAIGGAAVLAHPDDFQHIGSDIVARSALDVLKLAEYAVR